ncbi:MAG TPA: methionyl-tRNA formyltransferase [Flavobacteriaceae bacterium]|nr:methionyl-tRNA formyltransferase [Flavobacteriaceae bacterium]
MKRELKIIFMGTPDFAVGVLEALIAADFNVAAVVTAPDKPAGRGRKPMESAVKKYAQNKNIPLLQPINLKEDGFLQDLRNYNANVFVVVAFRMLPRVVWEIPEYGTFNLHASLLPEYRGAAPINWTIINGEVKTGVTTFFIDENIDTGAIIEQKEIDIAENETAETLHDKLMKIGGDLVVSSLKAIAANKIVPKKQSEFKKLKAAPKLTPENTRIDWNQETEKVERLIRGLSPFPAAWTMMVNGTDDLRVKIFQVKIMEGEKSGAPGDLIQDKKRLFVNLPDGKLELLEIQLPGKKRMSVRDLLNGYSFSDNAHFY